MGFADTINRKARRPFQVTENNHFRPRRQRPRTKKIRRHQDQPWLWPEGYRPVFKQRQIRVKSQERGDVTTYGGLAVAHGLAMRLQLDKSINRQLSVLKRNLPYFESDHVLTHAYNLYIGGSCIEDIGHIQHSDAVKTLLGACRIPDPTTAGDFLRRFKRRQLNRLQAAIDEARQKVWRQLPRQRKQVATLDIDSSIKPVYGECKQGADFSRNGKWSYHPLFVTLAETNEVLRTLNRPGNVVSEQGAGEVIAELLPMVCRHFKKVRVRGDSKFYRRRLIWECEQHGAQFAFSMDGFELLHEKVEKLPESAWKPFRAHPERHPTKRRQTKVRRRKRPRHRRRMARKRGYRTLTTTSQQVAEFSYQMSRAGEPPYRDVADRRYRVIAKRQRVQVRERQDELFEEYRYRFAITNISAKEMKADEVIRFTYGRCDQENTIEQMKNGIASMRMPTGELLANAAFLMCGQLAWCLRAWLSLLALPGETLKWEWAWFRHAFVHVAAKITKSGRCAFVYMTRSHRHVHHLVIASQRIESFEFQ